MANAWEALVAKKWEELEVIEQDGRLLFPDAIRIRLKGGGVKEVPIVVRVLRKHERRLARKEAEELAVELKVDREKEPALFDELDTLCILARALRDRAEPHPQHMKAGDLESTYEMRSLEEIWSKYKIYEDLTDPRDGIQTPAEFWAVVGAMGRTRNILPLTECESPSQNSCILRLVDLALTSPTFSSWFSSLDLSTPAPSP